VVPVRARVPDPDPEVLVIDCDTCVARHPRTCEDCVVAYLCGPDEAGPSARPGPVVLAGNEVRTLGVLHEAGLVPRLRHLAPA